MFYFSVYYKKLLINPPRPTTVVSNNVPDTLVYTRFPVGPLWVQIICDFSDAKSFKNVP